VYEVGNVKATAQMMIDGHTTYTVDAEKELARGFTPTNTINNNIDILAWTMEPPLNVEPKLETFKLKFTGFPWVNNNALNEVTYTTNNNVTLNTVAGRGYTVSANFENTSLNAAYSSIRMQIVDAANNNIILADVPMTATQAYSCNFIETTDRQISVRFWCKIGTNNVCKIDNIILTEQMLTKQYPQTYNTKILHYNYDLISGKVNKVIYQPKKPDQFIHRYEYDADNRITDIYTSRDGIIETHEAKYFYYPHGPLSRIELGEDVVQGVDYYYTLQGWLKGMNSSAIMENNDPGKDGSAGCNSLVPKDQYNTLLAYYQNDYMAINGLPNADYEFNSQTMPFYSGLQKNKGLFNGNIACIANGLPALAGSTPNDKSKSWLLEEYKYDQLNRLVASSATLPNANGVGFNNNPNSKVRTSYKYDGNGNITELVRTAYLSDGVTTALLDSFKYVYAVNSATGKLESNRLYHVKDPVDKNAFTEDIDDQGAYTQPNENSTANTNYDYSDIGELAKDKAEGIDTIIWNVYGKPSKVYFNNGKPSLQFLYDATGNRVAKLLKNVNPKATNDTTYAVTYYWRDAEGNVLATESKKYFAFPSATTSNISHTTEVEYNIYGSSRLGVYQDTIPHDVVSLNPYGKYVREKMHRQYELTNHLGNVMATVSDVKTYNGSGYIANVVEAQHYYAFGMTMPNKTYFTNKYGSMFRTRWGYNGAENIDEIYGRRNYIELGERGIDTRLGRLNWSKDRLANKFSYQSPYVFAANSPLAMIDHEGNQKMFYLFFIEEKKDQFLSKKDKKDIAKKVQMILDLNGIGDINVAAYNSNKRQDVNIFDNTDIVVYISSAKLLSSQGLNVSEGGNAEQGNDIEASVNLDIYKLLKDSRPSIIVNDYISKTIAHEGGHNYKTKVGIEKDDYAFHPYSEPNLMSPGTSSQLARQIKYAEGYKFRNAKELYNSDSYLKSFCSNEDSPSNLFSPNISKSLNFIYSDKTAIQDFLYDGFSKGMNGIGINFSHIYNYSNDIGNYSIGIFNTNYSTLLFTNQGTYLPSKNNASNNFKNVTPIE
jgi:hypothetical protein